MAYANTNVVYRKTLSLKSCRLFQVCEIEILSIFALGSLRYLCSWTQVQRDFLLVIDDDKVFLRIASKAPTKTD